MIDDNLDIMDVWTVERPPPEPGSCAWSHARYAGSACRIFIRDHHHLISPWMYAKKDRLARDNTLLRRRWAAT